MADIAEETTDVPMTPEEEAAALAEFESGFTGDDSASPAPTDPPEPSGETPGDAAPPGDKEGDTAGEVVPPTGETPPTDVPKSLTEEQVVKLVKDAMGDVNSSIGRLRDDAFGRMGGLERVIKSIQSSTPEGKPIEITADDLKEVADEYELLAPRLATSLTRVLGKMKAAGTGSAPALTQEEIDQRIEARATEIATRRSSEIHQQMNRNQLTAFHRDWVQVVGPKDSDTEFRRWLKTDPQKEAVALSSHDPFLLADVITEFKEHKKKQEAPPPKPTPSGKDPKTARLREAVPVRGGGGKPPMPRAKTAEEEFNEGFA